MKDTRLLLLLWPFTLLLSEAGGQKIPDNRIKRMVVEQGSEQQSFGICYYKPKHLSAHADYHWYLGGVIRHNKGGFDGHLLHGVMQRKDKDGRLLEQGRYRIGLRTGKWLAWNEEGEIIKVTRYRKGKRDGREWRFENELAVACRRYRNDKALGPERKYADGKPVKEERLKKPKRPPGEKKLKVKVEKEKKKPDEERKQFFEWLRSLLKSKKDRTEIVS